MFKFLKQVSDYATDTVQAAKYIGQGLSVTFDHMQRRPITVQYPYEKHIPSEQYRRAGITLALSGLSAYVFHVFY